MAATYKPATDRGKVRLLLTDRDGTMFQDDEIDAFLALEGSVRRAAAAGLETIATSEALIQKKMKMLDLETDGPALAKALRDGARALREADDESGAFAIAEMVTTPWAEREHRYNDMLRES